MPYPKEFYREDVYRTVHSLEEEALVKGEGWGDKRDPAIKYIPLSAVGTKKPAVAMMTPPEPLIEEPVKRGPGRPPKIQVPDRQPESA